MGILSPIDDQSPFADYDPTQSLHTPGGVLPPIMSGDGSIAKSPDIEGAADQLSKRGLLSHDLGKQIYSAEKPPEPAASPGTIDWYKQRGQQIEYQKEHPWGSPISAHPGVLGKIFHGLAAAGNIAGDVLAPGTMSLIPGTQLNRSLEESSNAAGLQRAETEHNQETEAAAAETKANAEQENADTAKAASGQPKAKEEEWDVVQGFEGPNGEPILKEKNSGQMKLATVPGAKSSKPEKPDTPEQQFIDDETKQGKTIEQATADYAKTAHPQQPEKPQRQLGITPDNKVIEITPGMTLPEGTQTVGGEIKQNAGKQSAEDALAYAKDYLSSGKFTGAGDEALMEKYFELAKPSSGFRMTQPQIEMLTKAQDIMNSVTAKGKHLFSPESPYFSPTLRQQIVDTMSRIESTKGPQGKKQPSAEPQRPATVPEGYVFKADGPKGRGWYKP